MKKFFASICAIVFVTLAPWVYLGTFIQGQILTPNGFKHIVRAAELGERLPSVLSFFISQQAAQEEGLGDIFFQFGGQVVFEQVLQQVFPPQDVYDILDDIIDTGFSWWVLGQPIETLSLQIDLSSAKQRLQPVILSAVQKQIDQLPECTSEELKQFSQANEDTFNLSCKPPGMSLETLLQAGVSSDELTASTLESIPDTFDVQSFFQQMQESDPEQLSEINRQVETARSVVRLGGLILRILQVAVIVSLILVGLFRLSTLKTFLTWIAWTVSLPGLQLIGVYFALQGLPKFLQQSVLQNQTNNFNQFISLDGIVYWFTGQLSAGVLWLGIGMVTLGGVLFCLRFVPFIGAKK